MLSSQIQNKESLPPVIIYAFPFFGSSSISNDQIFPSCFSYVLMQTDFFIFQILTNPSAPAKYDKYFEYH